MSAGFQVVVTCEHAGNRVPPGYASLFRGADEALASHRGWDPGALALARVLAGRLSAPLRYSLTTRLLVDPNRSAGSRALFSEYSSRMPERERAELLARYHARHWNRVMRVIEAGIRGHPPVLHVGVHTFTPVWEGKRREVDVGVLYDPARSGESRVATEWIHELACRLPDLRVRANEPYRGTDDGLTTELRRRYPASLYLGLEIEVGQALAGQRSARRAELFVAITMSLAKVIRGSRSSPRAS